ncbi:hypothetical protein [Micromonospora tarensis]|uniref:Uncharacterized protein n=1 Tax=Micromonospora tarensis TaxID=2806100 RepID=A0ABS1YB61_9ACTN|nr:hypothetical protein [Micromonospora tarensis]MBM0274642.1 hypothetical protein [Micromonospora tarensis]
MPTAPGPEHPRRADRPPAEPAERAGQAGHDKHAERAGHDKHAGHEPAMFRRRFWVCLVLTVPVVLTSHLVAEQFGLGGDRVPGRSWVGPW